MRADDASDYIFQVLTPDFDEGVYDDILETVRRQGFFDCLGSDLIRAEYKNDFPIVVENDPRYRARRERAAAKAEKQRAERVEWFRRRREEEAEVERQAAELRRQQQTAADRLRREGEELRQRKMAELTEIIMLRRARFEVITTPEGQRIAELEKQVAAAQSQLISDLERQIAELQAQLNPKADAA